ncbi:MAG: DNA adenine methylase [Anaerolineae bacterium]|nr:DNA adenine methylase [Anaerolineae bacterium]
MKPETRKLRAPFPYFGGKSLAASLIWSRLGNVKSYVEPFAGSLAVLLARPHEPTIEIVNDKDAYLTNFWRAIKHKPDSVADWADWPINEVDLLARYQWLVTDGAARVEKLKDDPDYYDPKVAGWWVWGISQWIGSGWLEKPRRPNKKLPRIAGLGNGIHRSSNGDLRDYLQSLSDRLRHVRVTCGDWLRVTKIYEKNTVTGFLLDPPYSDKAERQSALYRVDDLDVAHQVREWAIANGNNPKVRIALCGYETEHQMPDDWECVAWKAGRGYAKNNNRLKERIWFSPHCLKSEF